MEASAAGEQRAGRNSYPRCNAALHNTWRVGSLSGLAAGMQHGKAPDSG
jgi:hypothetical protein